MRPESLNPLTLEEHRELGAELRGTRSRLRELCELVISVYGPQTRAAFEFVKTAESVDRLCQDLQAQAARDWPGHHTDGFYT
ncbi:MAG: hypothetical protein ABSF25_02360 [Bryobacteraceae bacterium]|jgi:hypothetical protein